MMIVGFMMSAGSYLLLIYKSLDYSAGTAFYLGIYVHVT